MFADVIISQRSSYSMHALFKHIRLLLLAVTALALSAGLAFGANPPAATDGLATAAEHAGKTVPVAGDESLGEDDEDVSEDEDTNEAEDTDEADTDEGEVEDLEDGEETDEVEGAEDAGENCATDPSSLSPADLESMRHGSIVCWAAHQAEWPAWFSNHGAFVRCWAHQGKTDAASCTEDPTLTEVTVEEPTGDQAPTSHGKGHGKGHAKGKTKHQQ